MFDAYFMKIFVYCLKKSENQDDFLKSSFFDLQKCAIPQKKSSEKFSVNFEIILEVSFLNNDQNIFSSFDTRNF